MLRPFPVPAISSSSYSRFSSSLNLLRSSSRCRIPRGALCCCNQSTGPKPESPPPPVLIRANHAGLRLEEKVEVGVQKTRIDSWISSRIRGVSRARIQSSIKSGLVSVNGRAVNKVITRLSFWFWRN